jgi:hypothetical protein
MSDQFVMLHVVVYVLSYLVPVEVYPALTGSTDHPCSPQPVCWLTQLCRFTVWHSGDKLCVCLLTGSWACIIGVEANLYTPRTSEAGAASLFNRFNHSRALRLSYSQSAGSVEEKSHPSQPGLVLPSWGLELLPSLTQLRLLKHSRALRLSCSQSAGSVEQKSHPSQPGLVLPSWGPELLPSLAQLHLLKMWHNKLLLSFRMTKILLTKRW